MRSPDLIVRGPASTNEVAFTFDMGSGVGSVHQVLDTLRASAIWATFFVTGKWVADNPAALKAIVAAGHEVGNHSYYHPNFTEIGRQEMLEELNKTEQVVKQVAGVTTHPYFRPPYGAYNAQVLSTVYEAGFRTVYWTLDSTDWREDATTDSVVARVLKYAQPGSIIVMHASTPKAAGALPQVIPALRAKGMLLTSLSGLLDEAEPKRSPATSIPATPTLTR